MNTTLKNKLAILVSGPKKKTDKIELERDVLSARFLSEIQIYLDAHQLTRRELAKRTGVSASFISQLFTADKTISLEFIAKVQLAFGIQFSISLAQNSPKTSHQSPIYKLTDVKVSPYELEEDSLLQVAEAEPTYKRLPKGRKKKK